MMKNFLWWLCSGQVVAIGRKIKEKSKDKVFKEDYKNNILVYLAFQDETWLCISSVHEVQVDKML